MYKEAKLFGKDDDGEYLGRIEQIETSKEYDLLDISNRKPNGWIFSLFTKYRQIGRFRVPNPHQYHEGQDIIATKKDNKIVMVKS